MSTTSALYYIEANVVSVLVIGILLIYNRTSIDRQERQIKFDRALIAFMLYFAADSFWAALVSEIIPKTRTNMVTVVFLLYLFMVAITYFWLEYILALEQVEKRNRPSYRFAVLVPFIVSTAALVIQYTVAPGTLINEANDTLPSFIIYITVVPNIYIITIMVYSIRKSISEENRTEKLKHLFTGAIPLMVLAAGIVQQFYPKAPLFCSACMMLLMIFYIQSVLGQVSVDALTGLNNRGQLMRYISQRSNLYQEGRRTVVVMMDINDFKGINDNYGHAEGDRALVTVSDALRKTVGGLKTPAVIARYGGDEFMLILHPGVRQDVSSLIEEIRSGLDAEIRRAGMPYALTLSAGYDELRPEPDTVQNCTKRADQNSYRDKQRSKLHNSLADHETEVISG